MTTSAGVIIPTTGRHSLRRCLESVLSQKEADVLVYAYVVCDGPKFEPSVSAVLADFAHHERRIRALVLPENVGGGGYYGHRIYAGCTHFVNADYVLFLDEDNWFDPEHVASLIARIKHSGLDWAFSLRKIHTENGVFVANDDCESLGGWLGWQGYNLVDTSAYCMSRNVAIHVASLWHGGWGQDRIVLATLLRHFPKCATSGRYTLNYSLGGNSLSVDADYFLEGNQVMATRHAGRLPWRLVDGSHR